MPPRDLFSGFSAVPDRVAFEVDGVSLRYGELEARAKAWASKLVGVGATKRSAGVSRPL